MPRPRKYAHSRYRDLRWNSNEYVHDLLAVPSHEQVFDPRLITLWRRQAGRQTGYPKTKLALPSPARDSCPLTITLLLDCILRTNPDAYLNAGNLMKQLTDGQYGQILWNPTVIGRLLSCLFDVAAENPPPNGAPPMVDRVNHGGMRNYIIQPDIHTWRWLGCLRQHFGRMTADLIAKQTDLQEQTSLTADELWNSFHFAYGEKPVAA